MIREISYAYQHHTPISPRDLHGSPSGEVITYRIEDMPEEKQRWIASLPVLEKKKKKAFSTLGYQSKARGLRK